MDIFKNSLQELLKLWNKRTEFIEYSDEDNWMQPILNIEQDIEEKTYGIASQAFENKSTLLEFYQELDSSNKFIVFYIMLSTVDSKLFDSKFPFIEDINLLLNSDSSNVPIYLGKAANFADPSSAEAIIDIMLKSGSEDIVNRAYDIIGNQSLTKYEAQCITALKSIVNSRELSEYTLPRSLLTVISKLHAVSAVNLLENILTNEQLKLSSNLSLQVCKTLITLGSLKGWEQYLEFCESKKWAYEDTLTIGLYGGKNDHQFIIDQINSSPSPDWLCGYIYSLGLYGSTSDIDILIDYCTHSEFDIRQHALDAFYEITGTRDEVELNLTEDELDYIEEELKYWWESNQEKFDDQTRYKQGLPFSLTQFISELSNESPIKSLRNLNSLSIYTQISLPYNAHGFLKDRLEGQRIWKEWYEKNSDKFPNGAWYRWGKVPE